MAKNSIKLSSAAVAAKPNQTKPALIVQFENGNLRSLDKPRLKFTSYKDKSKNAKRIVVAKSSRLNYVGCNFESGLSEITSTELKVCVVNRKTNTVKFLDADFFQLKPQLKCSKIISEKNDMSFTEKSSDLTLTFGSKIQKKKINSRIKYSSSAANSSDSLDVKTISDTTMEQISIDIPNENNISTVIPPQNSSATNIDEIYNLYDIISKEDFDMLDSEAQIFLDAKQDTIQLWKKEERYPDFLIQFMENNILSMDVYKAKLLCYLHFMFCFLRTGYTDWRKKDPVPSVPQPFKQKLMDCFTINKSMPMRLKDKLLAYITVLGLKLNNYVINCNVFASSTKMAIKRITAVAYVLGCHVSGSKSDTKIIELKLPLYKFEGFSKRKFK